jgi:hypothetical protein
MACGDRLEVERRLAASQVGYTHHGIDMGDGTVVHARPWDFAHPFGGGSVVRTSLADFAAGRPVRVVACAGGRFPPAEIAARAAAQVGRPGYSPLVDNCEHFATWCGTGQRTSRQIDILAGRIQAAATRTAAVVTARVVAGTAGRVAIRTAVGMSVRVGLKTLVPAALVAEAAALASEWRAHQAGLDEEACRRAGQRAGLAASAAAFAVAGVPGGPPGMLAGALAGMTAWAWGSLAGAAIKRAALPDQPSR